MTYPAQAHETVGRSDMLPPMNCLVQKRRERLNAFEIDHPGIGYIAGHRRELAVDGRRQPQNKLKRVVEPMPLQRNSKEPLTGKWAVIVE